MQVDFYQFGRTPLPRLLAQIATRVLDGDGRLLVVAADADQAAALDEALWAGEDSFLPHGRAAPPDDPGADQPVLIASDCAAAANGARNVALVDGRWREEALAFDRAFHFFDGDSLDAARAAWRALGAVEGVTRNYWSQDDEGRWRKTA